MVDRGSRGHGVAIAPQTLRAAVGFVGIGLPAIVVLVSGLSHHGWFKGSISAYYDGAHDELVGLLFTIGIFFFSYRGFDDLGDRIAGALASAAALGVALFPSPERFPAWCRDVHYVCASTLLLTLAAFSFFLFTKTDPALAMTPEKIKRNRLYRVCGVLMFVFTLAAGVSLFDTTLERWVEPWHGGYWFETFALEAFGVSWIVKAELTEFLWADPKPRSHVTPPARARP
jgi:hypothetical protein